MDRLRFERLLKCYTPTHSSRDLLISKLPKLVHKHIKTILKKSRDIAIQHNIFANSSKDYATTICLICPNAPSIERMVLMVNFMDWSYYMNDLFDELNETDVDKEILIKCLKNAWLFGTVNTTKISTSLNKDKKIIKNLCNAVQFISYLRTNLLKYMPNKYYVYFMSEVYKWFKIELNAKQQQKIKSVDDYLAVKPQIAGMGVIRAIVQLLNDWYFDIGAYDSDDKTFSDKLFEYETCLQLIGGLSNDLFSFPKEIINQKGKLKCNYFNYSLIETENNLAQSVQNLLDLNNTIYNKSQKLFHLLSSDIAESTKLTKHDQMNFMKYLVDLNNMINGFYHFQFESQRYQHKYHIFIDKISKNTCTTCLTSRCKL